MRMPKPFTSSPTRWLSACAVAASTLLAGQADAAEFKLLSGGAVQGPITKLLEARRARTGDKIEATFTPIGAIMKKLEAGERFDVLIVPAEAADELTKQNRVIPATRLALGETGIGVAVRTGAPKPDISTPEAFKQTLLKASSIVMVDPERGTSGRYLAGLFKEMGIAEALKPKTRLIEGGYVVEAVGRGEIELGVHQITEILPVKNVTLVGPLPAPIQKITTYVALVMAGSTQVDAAAALIRELGSSESRPVFEALGYSAPTVK